jgi:hypothetical protein
MSNFGDLTRNTCKPGSLETSFHSIWVRDSYKRQLWRGQDWTHTAEKFKQQGAQASKGTMVNGCAFCGKE